MLKTVYKILLLSYRVYLNKLIYIIYKKFIITAILDEESGRSFTQSQLKLMLKKLKGKSGKSRFGGIRYLPDEDQTEIDLAPKDIVVS